jgi:glycosyltransferase involved in cell wall biosynthesis
MKIANVIIADSWGEITPEALNKGIGGREGALIYLSREWARQGHEVTSFVPVEKGKRFDEKSGSSRFQENPVITRGYHEYIPLSLTKPMLANFNWDVAIAWECPTVFEDERVRDRIGLKVTEMQVAHLSPREQSALEQYCDVLAVLSEWAGDLLLHSGVKIDKENVKVFPNGVDISRYPLKFVKQKFNAPVLHNPKFVYSSSPDRGLWQLLQSWPYIREEFPEAELSVCYGVEKWSSYVKWAHTRSGEMAVQILKLMDQPGITDLGKIGQDKLAELQLEADAWLYPLDSIQSTETGCITAIENAAAGNTLITTDCDCMEEEFGKIGTIVPLPFNAEEYASEAIKVLRDEDFMNYQRESGREFAEQRDWGLISKQWLQFFNDRN